MAHPRDIYAQLLESRRAALAQSDGRIRSHWRVQLVTLLSAVALVAPALDHTVSIAWELLPAVLFLALFVSRDRLVQSSEVHRRAVRYFEFALARLEGNWAGRGEPGERHLDPVHPYARDLDLFGEGSLFELLCQARTPLGQDRLAAWLLEPAPPRVIRERQTAVAELAARLDFREDLAVLGEHARTGVDAEALFAWAEREPLLRPSPFQIVARGLSVLGVTAVFALIVYLASVFGIIQLPPKTVAGLEAYFLLMTVAYSFVLARFKKRTDRIIREIESAGYDLSLIAGVLRRLESERFHAPRLAALRAELDTEGWPPSRRIARLNRLIELIDSRRNGALAVIAPVLLWDLHLSYAIEGWRGASGPGMRRWLNAVGEIEALSSLAGYHYEHPSDAFPEFTLESPRLDATAIGHPLLNEEKVVCNNVRLDTGLRLMVVSGSNMSGKSTLLRTLGLNVVLAQAGAPVRAKRLVSSPLAIAASIRTVDSLQASVSRFYAEISRLRQIIDLTSGTVPVLFLVDEFLHGTNSHDRRIGADALVQALLKRGAIGLLTTHDLALAEIAGRVGPRALNVHFEDQFEAGRIRFDYKLRPGVVRTGNAIELMRSIGLVVRSE